MDRKDDDRRHGLRVVEVDGSRSLDEMTSLLFGPAEALALAVAPSHRRRGLGRRLHDQMLAGVARRYLLSTDDRPNDPAVRLYSSAGWTRLGELRPGAQIMGLIR